MVQFTPLTDIHEWDVLCDVMAAILSTATPQVRTLHGGYVSVTSSSGAEHVAAHRHVQV